MCDKRDRQAGLLTPFSGLLQNDLFEAEIWREVFSNNIIVTLVIQGFQGLHTVPKTPENLRICPFCHLNEVEHELHFLFIQL